MASGHFEHIAFSLNCRHLSSDPQFDAVVHSVLGKGDRILVRDHVARVGRVESANTSLIDVRLELKNFLAIQDPQSLDSVLFATLLEFVDVTQLRGSASRAYHYVILVHGQD